MRQDVLEAMADELLERAAHPLASFSTWEQGRRKLDGVRSSRKWDLDRETDRELREHDRKMQVEIRRLMKLRARRKNPEVYRDWNRRYEAANKERRRQQRRARYWKNRPRMLAVLKASREKHRAKRNAECLRNYHAHREERRAKFQAWYDRQPRDGKRKCSVCGQPGHNRIRHLR